MAIEMDVTRQRSLLPVLKEGLPDARGWMQRRIFQLVVVGLVAILPLIPNSNFYQTNWISLGFIFAMVGLSLNQVIGYAGQVSLGHHAFVGVGAFTSALLVSKAGFPFFLAIFAAAGTGALAALLLGFVALRLSGLVLALITFGYGEIATKSIFAVPSITGGGAGVAAPRPPGFTSDAMYAYLCLAILAILWYLDYRLTTSKAGRAIFAIRENEVAAASFGINVVNYKLMLFVISGAFAGVAGTFFASHTQFVVSNDFDLRKGLLWVLMVVVGGLSSRPGVFMASMTFAILTVAFTSQTVALIILAVQPMLLLVTLVLYPGGLGQQLRPFTDWVAGKKFTMKHSETTISSGGGGVRP